VAHRVTPLDPLASISHAHSFTHTHKYNNIRFEVLTAVVMKRTDVFFDMTSCSPLKDNRRFGGIYRPHLQGRRIR
jgi:hypothetical protein